MIHVHLLGPRRICTECRSGGELRACVLLLESSCFELLFASIWLMCKAIFLQEPPTMLFHHSKFSLCTRPVHECVCVCVRSVRWKQNWCAILHCVRSNDCFYSYDYGNTHSAVIQIRRGAEQERERKRHSTESEVETMCVRAHSASF